MTHDPPQKRDEDEAERLADPSRPGGTKPNADKFDYMYPDSPSKRAVERGKERRKRQTEEEERRRVRDQINFNSNGNNHSTNNGISILIGLFIIYPLSAFLLGGVFMTFVPISESNISLGLATLGF